VEGSREIVLSESEMFIFSIDICQFSMTSLLNSSEDKSRSISFRSIILIMIYAGTIILNLLAASVDSKFPMINAENSTVTPETNDSVSDMVLMRFSFLMNRMQAIKKYNSKCFQDNDEMVYLWNTLSIARSFGAIIGWLMISSMNTDLLYSALVEMDKYHVHP
jgi:transmembrane protein 237